MTEEELQSSGSGEEAEDTLILPPLPPKSPTAPPPPPTGIFGAEVEGGEGGWSPGLPPELPAECPQGSAPALPAGCPQGSAPTLPPECPQGLAPALPPELPPELPSNLLPDAPPELPPALPPDLPPSEPSSGGIRVNGWAILWVVVAIGVFMVAKNTQQKASRDRDQSAFLRESNGELQGKIKRMRFFLDQDEKAQQEFRKLEEDLSLCQKENEQLSQELHQHELQPTPRALRDQLQRLEREKNRALQQRAERLEREEKQAQARNSGRAPLQAPRFSGLLTASTPVAHEEAPSESSGSTAKQASPEQRARDEQIARLVAKNFRARSSGDAGIIRGIFAPVVCYQYAHYRAVNRENVVQDVVEGWAKWPVRKYELLEVATDGSFVEVIFRYKLSNPMTRASTSGYSKETWIVDESGKIDQWEEEVSRKARPKANKEYRTIKVK